MQSRSCNGYGRQRECIRVTREPVVVRQAAQLYRMIRLARKNGAFALVTVAARLVGKAIVPDFKAE